MDQLLPSRDSLQRLHRNSGEAAYGHHHISLGPDRHIGKEVFHVVGFSADGKIAFLRKIKRLALAETFKRLPPCVVGMEACLGAHFNPPDSASAWS